MITLERIKTVTLSFMGVDVLFDFDVPTAEDVEVTFRGPDAKDLKDSEIVKRFGRTFMSADITGWAEALKPEDVISLPGTYSLVNKAAVEVMQAAFVTEAEKN